MYARADNYSWGPKNVLLLFVSAVGESGRNDEVSPIIIAVYPHREMCCEGL